MSTSHPSPAPTITQESSDYLDGRIQDKQHQILLAKQRLVRLQVELAQLKKQNATVKGIGGIREQLRAVMCRE